MLDKYGIDTDEGARRFMGDKSLYLSCLADFREDTHYCLLIKALEKGDKKMAFANAHALKGLAGNLSMTTLYNSASELVEYLRPGSMSYGLMEPLVEKVTNDYENAIQGIVLRLKG